jgi:phosphosulfolactate synthase
MNEMSAGEKDGTRKNWRANDYKYSKMKLPTRQGKPRTKGMTAIIDVETDMLGWMGLKGMEDFLEIASDFVDYAKIQTHHSLMLPHDYIKHKVSKYREYDVTPFVGGILYELAYCQQAVDELILHLNRIGAPALEISENYITLDRDTRLKEFERFKKEGINVVYEFGRKHAVTPLCLTELESVISDCKNSGINHVIIEQDEIDLLEKKSPETLKQILKQSWFDRLFFEPNQFAFPEEHAGMIKKYGPDVNLCNITSGQVIRLEDFRLGMGRQVGFTYVADLI